MNTHVPSTQWPGSKEGPWSPARLPDCEIRMVAPRSTLPVSGKYVLIGAAVAAVLVSLRFVMIGAWPVLVFALLDIGALAVALYIFGRRPVPEERISLVDARIEFVRIDGSGRRDRLELPAFWTRLEASGRTELDCDLHLVFRQHRYPVGRCISAAARRSLIPQIEALLARARQP